MITNDEIKVSNKGLVEEISNIKANFSNIKSVFESRNPNIEYSNYVEELAFIMDKLEVLIGITEDEEAKKECGNLLLTIKDYKEKENLTEFEVKDKLIFELMDLTDWNKRIYRSDILLGIGKIGRLIKINREDLYSIKDRDLIYYSKLSMGINREADISDEARLLIGKELLVNLLEFVLNSYEKSKLPFSFYEKIMIINILDEIRLSL